jgi:hypothetical protein
MELGAGFALVEVMRIRDGASNYPGLLFFNRIQRRLVVVDVEVGGRRQDKGSELERYLGWLNLNERISGEGAPIGVLLRGSQYHNRVVLLNVEGDGSPLKAYPGEFPVPSILIEAMDKITDGVT